jgi:Cu/Ag efflux pump CusA
MQELPRSCWLWTLTNVSGIRSKALFEAFLLVAIVVFLFLGDLHAAIVPVIAVPVSRIGAFILLVPLGYSASTVSLLAIVLAIGIVVDDAIVVVDNVKRTMEEEPELSPAAAAKKAMTQVRRRSLLFRSCCSRSLSRSGSCPGSRAYCCSISP